MLDLVYEMSDFEKFIIRVKKIERGFRDIQDAATEIVGMSTAAEAYAASVEFFASEIFQVRSLSVFIFGMLAAENGKSLEFLKKKVSWDEDWRVQEVLAKAFDRFCADIRYNKALPVIRKWLGDSNPNVRRAVTEGLRIWTNRPYFTDNPEIAVGLLAGLRADESLYVRKSVGNALRDISKKHPGLVQEELSSWDLADRKVTGVYKLAVRFIAKDK